MAENLCTVEDSVQLYDSNSQYGSCFQKYTFSLAFISTCSHSGTTAYAYHYSLCVQYLSMYCCRLKFLMSLRYYTTEFDWNCNVVTIKQLTPLSKFDKWWMNKSMCIEGTYVCTTWLVFTCRLIMNTD